MSAMPPVSPETPAVPGFRFNVRVALLLVLLTAAICGAVIATDKFSRRDRTDHRHDADATSGPGSTKGVSQ